MFALAVRNSARLTMAVSRNPMVLRTFAAGATQKVHDLEDTLQKMHWTDTKDTAHEVFHLMEEAKTNHSIHSDAALDKEVEARFDEIQEMLSATEHPNHDEIQAKMTGLKLMLKNKLYYHAEERN